MLICDSSCHFNGYIYLMIYILNDLTNPRVYTSQNMCIYNCNAGNNDYISYKLFYHVYQVFYQLELMIF